MDFKILLISFVQGVGELLPISSSVNMFLVNHIMNMEGFNFAFKITLHVGSLLALLFYFRKEIFNIFKALFTSPRTLGSTYFWPLVAGTLPVVILGYCSRDFVKEFDDKTIMGILCIVFGILLYIVDKLSPFPKRQKTQIVSIWKALVIGIFQSIAVFPGVSRLGICITASRMLSLNRSRAIFFSIFLAIPSICGSLVLEIHKSFIDGSSKILFSNNAIMGMTITAIISAIMIVPCIKFMEKKGFGAIAIYRCLIGFIILKLDYIMRICF